MNFIKKGYKTFFLKTNLSDPRQRVPLKEDALLCFSGINVYLSGLRLFMGMRSNLCTHLVAGAA